VFFVLQAAGSVFVFCSFACAKPCETCLLAGAPENRGHKSFSGSAAALGAGNAWDRLLPQFFHGGRDVPVVVSPAAAFGSGASRRAGASAR